MAGSVLNKANRQLWLFGLFKIPLIGFCRPKIVELNQERIVIRIRLTRRTRNHLNSLYLGVFAIGADLSGGFHAFWMGKERNRNISLAFKNLSCEFLKRAEGDVYFVSNSGSLISEMMTRSQESGERQTQDIPISALVNLGKSGEEEVARFSIGLSIKDKGITK